jgi:hypothetical protein
MCLVRDLRFHLQSYHNGVPMEFGCHILHRRLSKLNNVWESLLVRFHGLLSLADWTMVNRALAVLFKVWRFHLRFMLLVI